MLKVASGLIKHFIKPILIGLFLSNINSMIFPAEMRYGPVIQIPSLTLKGQQLIKNYDL